MAATIWYLSRFVGAASAIGIAIGLYIVAAGWRMFLAPAKTAQTDAAALALDHHPDSGLRMPRNEMFGRLRSKAETGTPFALAADRFWMSTIGVVFLAIHTGRMPLSDDLLGAVSPFVATAGDLLMTLVFAMALVLPLRLAWRRATRPIERLAWTLRSKAKAAPMNKPVEWLMNRWLDKRFSFSLRLSQSRISLPSGLMLLLRLGLPMRDSRITSNSMFQWTGKNKASVGFWPLADIPYVAFGGKADMPIALRKGAMCHMTQGGHCMIDHHKRLGPRFSFWPPLT